MVWLTIAENLFLRKWEDWRLLGRAVIQLVEWRTHIPLVVGSSPTCATNGFLDRNGLPMLALGISLVLAPAQYRIAKRAGRLIRTGERPGSVPLSAVTTRQTDTRVGEVKAPQPTSEGGLLAARNLR